MRGITAIEEDWIALFAPYKCTFSKPLDTIKPRYDVESGKMKCHMTSTFGKTYLFSLLAAFVFYVLLFCCKELGELQQQVDM